MPDDQRRSRPSVPGSGARPDPGLSVTVLGSFGLVRDGASVPLGVDARRLVAYLAVHPRPQARLALANDLWPGVTDVAALRLLDDTTVALDVAGLLAATADGALTLDPSVQVDLTAAMTLVRRLPEMPAGHRPDVTLLAADILPSWTAAWIAVERERFRQIRLHALEELSRRLADAGQHDGAIEVAASAVRSAPSRESARRALIEAHLAGGNIAAAVAQYDEYQELLRSSVGWPAASGLDSLLPPSPAWPVPRARRTMPRSAVVLPGLRSVRDAGGYPRRLVSGGSVPGSSRQ
jgi:DNA-binding SARP family transcriptional activator